MGAGVVALADAADADRFGAKAANLARAVRAGLPVPDGLVLTPDAARSTTGDGPTLDAVIAGVQAWGGTLAVRSSAIGEDGGTANSAGQHVTRLGVRPTWGALRMAIAAVVASANAPHAVAHRGVPLDTDGPGASTGTSRLTHFAEPARAAGTVAVLIQPLIDAQASGVLFTVDPVSGARDLLIEAVQGLGEAVVGGQVTPESWRLRRDGVAVHGRPGRQVAAVAPAPGGGTRERPLSRSELAGPCLEPGALRRLARLAADCRAVFGSDALDIEWALARRRPWLLQCRPVSAGAGPRGAHRWESPATPPAPRSGAP